jgi:hypothetical protein
MLKVAERRRYCHDNLIYILNDVIGSFSGGVTATSARTGASFFWCVTMSEQNETLVSRLSNLKQQFSNASGTWTNFQSVFITWPEDKTRPDNLPRNLEGAYAVPVPSPEGESHYVNTFLSGRRLDTLNGRYRQGVAGMLIPRRSFGKFGGDAREIIDPDEVQAIGQRFSYLANEGSPLLRENGSKLSLSKNTLMWEGNREVWLLALHETIKPKSRRLTEFYTHETLEPEARKLIESHHAEVIGDVFLASVNAIDVWLRKIDNGIEQHLEVDIKKISATLGGKEYDLKSEFQARWLKIYAENPGVWISGSDLKYYDDQLDGSRTDRLRRGLPQKNGKLIETSKRNGARLKLK